MSRNSQPPDRHVATSTGNRKRPANLKGKNQPHTENNSFLSKSFLRQTGLALKLLQRGGDALIKSRQRLGVVGFGHMMMGSWAVLGAIATMLNLGITELLERQTQTFFFHLRGSVTAPEDIIILAIDEPSLEQDQFYTSDPNTFAHLEPVAQWPWQRTAYAIAIEKLMAAGAKTVALDLIFDSPSSWGEEDDARLLRAIEQHPGRVVLGASYEDQPLPEGQGTLTQLIEPIPIYRTDDAQLGFINFWIEMNSHIHRLSQQFPERLAERYPDQEAYFQELSSEVPSFDEATLQAAQVDYTPPRGEGIFYFGPSGTFQRYSFWTVIEPQTWFDHLNQGNFRNKIVIIGPTATLLQDLHSTPFGTMPGVEIHANAIATLLTQRAIADAIPNRYAQGIMVIILTMGSGIVISHPRQVTYRTLRTIGFLGAWSVLGYIAFVGAGLIIPVAIPLATISLSGISYVIAALVREKLHRLQLRQTLKQYASSPIIREIISKQDDLRDLLQERDHEVLGRMLVGRYQLVEVLGSGGFGETYIAADSQRPGQPLCVVKQLRPVTNDLKLFKLSKRLFQREAETLERLGKHDRIPQLLAYFEEEQEFYLVQEFIDGHPLRQELLPGTSLPEPKIVEMLVDLLLILEFIHTCGVIHRDIKPSNIIRRQSDQRLVLIDFGAVKELQNQFVDDQTQLQTVGIGTRGYMPSEQSAGMPRFNSDLYAVGILGIQALTGIPPEKLEENPDTSEMVWQDKASPSMELDAILSNMTRYSFKERYQTAREVLIDLDVLIRRYGLQHLLDAQQYPSATVNDTPHSLEHISFESLADDDSDLYDSAPYDDESSTLPWPSSMQNDDET